MFEIKVGMLVSYDYKYLYNSIPLVYQNADKIVLAIDKDRLTWSGLRYTIDDSFFNWLTQFDVQKKITLYEDKFFHPNLTTTECDTHERKMLAKHMGDGGWHIQIDSDEYFIDFEGFVNDLRTAEIQAKNEPVYVYCYFITLFKKLNEGFLYVSNSLEKIPVATNNPNYDYIRIVSNTKPILTNSLIVHQSWARTNEEIKQKLKSWGHSNDFNIPSYFKLWEAVDDYNYQYLKNFHPMVPKKWSKLSYVNQLEIPKLIEYFSKNIRSDTSKINKFKMLVFKILIRFANKFR